MWISREILPRVLLLNKFITAVALFLAAASFAAGDTAAAFLVEGPVKEAGLPFIYPNALDTYKGYYQYGKQKITVFFTSGKFLIPEDWKKARCGKYSGYRFTDTAPVDTSETSGSPVFYYKKDSSPGYPGWSVFVCFPEKEDCGFTTLFLERLEYFQRNNDPGLPPLLPAVLETTP